MLEWFILNCYLLRQTHDPGYNWYNLFLDNLTVKLITWTEVECPQPGSGADNCLITTSGQPGREGLLL